ncbi:CMP/dCMP deaminase [Heterostelium album PN500]|uniref:CMP/dCMP deaminase n=1 Tax=Heterostelium pallidum (strain ATCC 26659 / Pp 5 / PN500) TaxID=670386 RepID=D3B005_HETP5|nr:CMP/dCMP deaminase [Heterostelium album PN500]EFA84629.1 CMP/dCMP deaminase [Heterostelium album PN500]|eukprot:XP_020436742.1 CMP/dCMP deaminase [Heterostelium album PN500]
MYKYIFAILAVMFAVSSACSNSPWKTASPSVVKLPADLSAAELAFHEAKMMEIAQYAINETYHNNKIPNAIFTASIVHPNGTTICMDRNRGEDSSIRHGETQVILACSEKFKKNTWKGYYLYTTGESCPMCQAAIMWAGFDKVIYGTSVKTLYCELCMSQILVESNFINGYGYGLNDAGNVTLEIIGEVLTNVTTPQVFRNWCPGQGNETFWTIHPKCNSDYSPSCVNGSSILSTNFVFTFVAIMVIAISMLF